VSNCVSPFLHTPTKMFHGNIALLVIDFQKDFDVGAPIECANIRKSCENSLRIINAARDKGIPVIFTQEYHRSPRWFGYLDFGREVDGQDPVHTIIGTEGYELMDQLLPLEPTDYLVQKPRCSAFFDTDLDLILRSHGIETLIIIGVCTNIGVHYTFIDAHQKDYRVRVIEDCVAGTSEYAHEAALSQIEYLQAGAVVKSDKMIDALKEYEK